MLVYIVHVQIRDSGLACSNWVCLVCIDLQIHTWDEGTPVEETFSALNDLVKAGKVRYVAMSNAKGWQIQKIIELAKQRGWDKIVGVQVSRRGPWWCHDMGGLSVLPLIAFTCGGREVICGSREIYDKSSQHLLSHRDGHLSSSRGGREMINGGCKIIDGGHELLTGSHQILSSDREISSSCYTR